MTSVSALASQFSSLELNNKKAAEQQSSRLPLTKQNSQSNVAKLLTKFAAPNPFSTTTTPAGNPPAKLGLQRQHTAPAVTQTQIDIGRYDGGFEIDDEKRGEKIFGEAAEDLALDSSTS